MTLFSTSTIKNPKNQYDLNHKKWEEVFLYYNLIKNLSIEQRF